MRRQMTQAELAARVGASLPTVGKLERGDPTTSLSSMLRVLTALGLDKDIDLLARNDEVGRQLQDNQLKRTNPSGGTCCEPLRRRRA